MVDYQKGPIDPNAHNFRTTNDVHRTLEELRNKGDRQMCIRHWIDTMDASALNAENLLLIAEYSFNSKLYTEFIEASSKLCDAREFGKINRTHMFLNKILHSNKVSVYKKMSKENLIEVSGIYVKLSERYHRIGSCSESFQALENAAEIINATKVFPEKSLSICYFRLLLKLFLAGNMFFSFTNAMARLVKLSPCFGSQLEENDFLEFVERTFKIAEFKNEGTLFKKLFGGLPMLSTKEVRDILKKNMKYVHRPNPEEYADTCYVELKIDKDWERVLKGKDGHEIFCEDLSLLSFLKKNDIRFSSVDGHIIIEGYKYQSITRKVFLLKESFRKMDPVVSGDGKVLKKRMHIRPQVKREVVEKHTPDAGVGNKGDASLVKKDYFTKHYNLFRLYSREYRKMRVDIADDYEERNNNFEREFEDYAERERLICSELLGIKDFVFDAADKLNKKIENAREEERRLASEASKQEKLRKVKESSWRDMSSLSSAMSSHIGAVNEVSVSTSTVDTYARGSLSNSRDQIPSDIYVPPVLRDLSKMGIGVGSEENKDFGRDSFFRKKEDNSLRTEMPKVYIPPAPDYSLLSAGRDSEKKMKADVSGKPPSTYFKKKEDMADKSSGRGNSSKWRKE